MSIGAIIPGNVPDVQRLGNGGSVSNGDNIKRSPSANKVDEGRFSKTSQGMGAPLFQASFSHPIGNGPFDSADLFDSLRMAAKMI